MIFRGPYPDISIPNTSLPALILDRAERLCEKTALIDGSTGTRFSFSEFRDAVLKVAAGLARNGFKKGDVLALMCPNCPEYGVMFMASAYLGGINTTLNPTCTEDEIGSQLADSKAAFLFTHPQLINKVPVELRTSQLRRTFVLGALKGMIPFSDLLNEEPTVERTMINPDKDLVALPYSSGTTGISKGVMLTHRNLVANLRQLEVAGIFTDSDTIIGVLPFFHIYGMVVVLSAALYLGATLVTLPRFDMESFLEAMEKHSITYANLVPPLVLALVRNPSVDAVRLSNLKTIMCGAAPLSMATAQAFAEKMECRVTQGYGMTEASPVTHVAPIAGTSIPLDSVGPCAPNTECKIVALKDGRELGPQETGELYVRGPQVMKGYLDRPEETARMIDSNGWMQTGDIGYADEDGNFFIVDRVKELIKYKGFQVAPAELEALLLTHPAVADAAVIPSPDNEVGELPKAYLVTLEDTKEEAIMLWVAKRVAPHKRIRRIVFIDKIPKSASGKILRRVLIEQDRSGSSP